MRILLWILLGLAVLLTLVSLLRIGVRVEQTEQKLMVRLLLGPFHMQLYPSKKPETARNGTEAGTEQKQKRKKSAFHKPDIKTVREAVAAIWPPLKRALGKTRRSIRIDPLQFSLTVGGEEDPAAAAELYGKLHGAVWMGMPMLEQLLDIRNPKIHIGLNFDAAETEVEGCGSISIRIGTAVAILVRLAVPVLRWYLRYLNVQKEAAQPSAAASVVN